MNILWVIIILLLVLGLVGLPGWGWGWGYGPSSIVGMLFIVLLVIVLMQTPRGPLA